MALRRAPFLVTMGFLVSVASLAGESIPEQTAARSPVLADSVLMAPAGALSSVFYCGEGVKVPEASEILSVSNTGDRDVAVEITVFPVGAEPVRNDFDVRARQAVRVPRKKLTDVPGPMVVEPFGPGVIVEHFWQGNDEFVGGACPTRPSSSWYFAAGTTVRGVEQWLFLFNPFGSDAVLDVELLTPAGVARPEALQGLAVAPRSSISVPIHGYARRRQRVATMVRARTGRVVAEQFLVFGDDSSASGIARSIGSVAPALDWTFVDSVAKRQAHNVLAISNPGDLDTEVAVAVGLSGSVAVDPIVVEIPAKSVVGVRLGGCQGESVRVCVAVPYDVPFTARVTVTTDDPVVVEELATFEGEFPRGATSSLGSHSPARRFVVGRTFAQNPRRIMMTIANPGSRMVTARVSVVSETSPTVPAEWEEIRLAPARQRRFDLVELDVTNFAFVVSADSPVVVARTVMMNSSVTRSWAVPDRG